MNIKKFAKDLAQLFYIPIIQFSSEWEIKDILYPHSSSRSAFLSALAEHLPKDIYKKENPVQLYTYRDILHYGFIRIDDSDLLMFGPIIDGNFDNFIAQNFLKSIDLPITQTRDFLDYYESTPHYNSYRIAEILAFFFNTAFPSKRIKANDLLYKTEDTPIQNRLPLTPHCTNEEILGSIVKNNNFESELYSFVRFGQCDKIKTFLEQNQYGESGTLSASAMRQNKYLVITSIVLASRSAVAGGLNYNTATQLSDEYYRRVDEALTINELYVIHREMLLNYTKLVSDITLGKPSLFFTVLKVQHYIQTHITEKITTEDIARELQIGRSYLSTQFKKEVGINLGEYINRLKIDEAKRMMLTTDKSLAQIASMLDYATQSHFIEVFKRLEGITPTEFMKSKKL